MELKPDNKQNAFKNKLNFYAPYFYYYFLDDKNKLLRE